MKACISQATILNSPFEADPEVFARAGWPAAEIWLTKLETYLEGSTPKAAGDLFREVGVELAAAAAQGGLLLSQGAEQTTHWDHFRRRLDLVAELEIPTLILAADHASRAEDSDFGRAAAALAGAAEFAQPLGIRLALEFHKKSGICACLETALALIARAGAVNLGVCLDVFHYYTGPSKFEDLAYLTPENLAWVQLSDVSGVPRETAGDSDRILPGDGDFQLAPILQRLERLGYEGGVSLEVLNPRLWQVAADRVADLGRRALDRALAAAGVATAPRGDA